MASIVNRVKNSRFRNKVEKYLVLLAAQLGYFTLMENAPSFIVVGAQKSATTSLYYYLKTHPAVLLPARRKEAHYFDGRSVSYPDHQWYRSLFRVNRQRDVNEIKTTGELTPYYCAYPDAIRRIHEFNPRIKLIMMLRNPVDRAVSHYWMVCRRGDETLPMQEAFEAEDRRIAESVFSLHKHSYLLRGRYHEQITEIYRYFPREQVLIRTTADLAANPEIVMREVTDFIGVEPLQIQQFKHYSKKQYPQADDKTIAWLKAYFQPHNEKLADLYGFTFDD